MTPRKIGAVCAVGVLLFALAYMLPSTIGKASEMDEGAVNAYASRVLEGGVPHRDFLTFYGPGNPWLVAGAFEVFGESVGVERAVGVLYRLLILLSLFVLGSRLGGVVGGVSAAVVAMTITADDLIWAYVTYGALAFGLLGLALLAEGVAAVRPRLQTCALVGAGLASGVAVLMRFDFVAAVVLGAIPILALTSRHSLLRFGAGLLVTLAAYLLHLATVGPAQIQRVVEDLLAAGSGRSLQRPTIWEYPGSLLAVANLVIVGLVCAGAFLVWRSRRDLAARVVLAAGLFSLALLPLTISRMDPVHIRPYAIVPLSLIPGLVLLLVRSATQARRVTVAASLLVSAGVVWGAAHYGHYTLDHFRSVRDVRSGDRGFYDDDGAGARVVVERARSLASAGDSLFVGPQDLRRTNYGPTYMYFLLRELRPASYYMEMNPGTANREGSGLADELRRADWLILTSEWDNWSEPNDSSKYGPSEPNDVVRDDFCLRLERGQYRLYERCDRAA